MFRLPDFCLISALQSLEFLWRQPRWSFLETAPIDDSEDAVSIDRASCGVRTTQCLIIVPGSPDDSLPNAIGSRRQPSCGPGSPNFPENGISTRSGIRFLPCAVLERPEAVVVIFKKCRLFVFSWVFAEHSRQDKPRSRKVLSSWQPSVVSNAEVLYT